MVAKQPEELFFSERKRMRAWSYILATAIATSVRAQTPAVGSPLPRWTPGTLDIHQISTGRGNSALFIMPDGTTMLVDAGAAGDGIAETEPHPDASRAPGDWIARYVKRHLPASTSRIGLRPDHTFPRGSFRAAALDIGGQPERELQTVRDHAGGGRHSDSHVDRPWLARLPVSSSIHGFVDGALSPISRRTTTERNVGDSDFGRDRARRLCWRTTPKLIRPSRSGTSSAMATCGRDAATRRGPRFRHSPRCQRPTGRTRTCAVLDSESRMGRFGILPAGTFRERRIRVFRHGTRSRQASRTVVGRVDVHVVNQHGSMGEESEAFLGALASSVLIIPSWAPSHPAPDVLKRIVNSRLAPESRSVFVTDLRPAARTVIGQRANAPAGPPGHIVVRVEPGGARYWVYRVVEQ